MNTIQRSNYETDCNEPIYEDKYYFSVKLSNSFPSLLEFRFFSFNLYRFQISERSRRSSDGNRYVMAISSLQLLLIEVE